MESVSNIRRWMLVEESSIQPVARATGLSRNTNKKYLKDESPPSYQRQAPPVRHKLCIGFDLWLQDQKRPLRERLMAQKLYEQHVAEGYTGSYSPVQRFVRDLKRAGAGSGEAFIPLHFAADDALQFDWSEERVVLGGVVQKIKVAHFRLCHSRKPFVIAYPGEALEMVLDAFVRALAFYDSVPRRVIIDNPKMMVTYVSRSKDRIFHPRFLALMNHYVMEPVACTPAAGWEKGQVKNQVQFLRGRLFVPKPAFDDLDALNAWLRLRGPDRAGIRSGCQRRAQAASPATSVILNPGTMFSCWIASPALCAIVPHSWAGNCPRPCTGSENTTWPAKVGTGSLSICFFWPRITGSGRWRRLANWASTANCGAIRGRVRLLSCQGTTARTWSLAFHRGCGHGCLIRRQ